MNHRPTMLTIAHSISVSVIYLKIVMAVQINVEMELVNIIIGAGVNNTVGIRTGTFIKLSMAETPIFHI